MKFRGRKRRGFGRRPMRKMRFGMRYKRRAFGGYGRFKTRRKNFRRRPTRPTRNMKTHKARFFVPLAPTSCHRGIAGNLLPLNHTQLLSSSNFALGDSPLVNIGEVNNQQADSIMVWWGMYQNPAPPAVPPAGAQTSILTYMTRYMYPGSSTSAQAVGTGGCFINDAMVVNWAREFFTVLMTNAPIGGFQWQRASNIIYIRGIKITVKNNDKRKDLTFIAGIYDEVKRTHRFIVASNRLKMYYKVRKIPKNLPLGQQRRSFQPNPGPGIAGTLWDSNDVLMSNALRPTTWYLPWTNIVCQHEPEHPIVCAVKVFYRMKDLSRGAASGISNLV